MCGFHRGYWIAIALDISFQFIPFPLLLLLLLTRWFLRCLCRLFLAARPGELCRGLVVTIELRSRIGALFAVTIDYVWNERSCTVALLNST
ncbi:hypothetical protein BOTBODRAFT_568237 [Botryobasidium botryosum FD-172 SS1]|uniref:Uncharacterized protein n=1 Tax=Botryobasidium botryosum (strain FD-172 SS1) TaxID=930990 RepID=A0A067M9P7_BOTB1|nr:hypothetical protein BOTBODRAFT_568237 [Botryobasidium botryosum FD-172 SS1]